MKIEWQPDDIQAGRRIGHPNRGEQWMIGYEAGMRSDEPRWRLVSLSDGIIGPMLSREDMALRLNDSGELPTELLPATAKGQRGGRA